MNSCKTFLAVLACITFQFYFSYSQEQKIETVIQTGHYASVTSVAFSPDGKFAATGSSDKTIKLWEVPTGREIRSYLNNNEGIQFLVFSPDGKQLASIDAGYHLKLWEVETSKETGSIKIPGDHILSAAYSPDGKYLVTGSEKNYAILWDPATGNEIKRFSPQPAGIRIQKNFRYPTARSVQISSDG